MQFLKKLYFYHINVMYIRSRDLLRPQTPKKSSSKKGSSLNLKLFNFPCYKTTYNIKNYETVLGNI